MRDDVLQRKVFRRHLLISILEVNLPRCTQCNWHWREALHVGPQGRHWAPECQPKAGHWWHCCTPVPTNGRHWLETGTGVPTKSPPTALLSLRTDSKTTLNCAREPPNSDYMLQ